MKIIKLKEVDSTHTYLKEYIKNINNFEPTCIITNFQTNGVGSRGNSWSGVEGNLFFSFAFEKEQLTNDLPLQSCSIYFSYLLKSILKNKGSKVWIKWPNDFYIDNKKIGGTITTISNNIVLCGIGLNLKLVNNEFGKLDINIDIDKTLGEYFNNIENKISWKQIFSDFKVEFQNSRKFHVTINNKKKSLEKAILNSDGSINIDKKKVFSLR
ncbi:biotin--[acetyl-CoA-carboxylase] ligase [Malaciobacter marinus]|uniref:Biotin--[acetyl-CoA-carboxylase] ligase n=1 Tax=Malaciobacter marinus TaxID=505249 RepID=A0A347TMD5_9BACT|nr:MULTISPECIES: biotin--[acetyl-CoA-carboxylase] ligase [Malaciobacter]AXX87763.1 biotin-[acetyl-CoA-carboxylase] ligase [Malaciobacter marinus]PHO12492.1 biotin--[acetyl-CoA-carboxylase] ligase [Malaciobacter marinus]PHO16567.1 biotin--[acetyl-CoA-carboxylase] ligase [Malaciobacter marinus]RYA22965.1 biotin--[acetyl-CoA-carboxylase] ligase [Malaciobacter halophilus]